MDTALQQARYISLVTYRKDGREVATPVWCAVVGGKLCVYSGANAGKVKRIRATGRVKVAPCDMRGRVHGAWATGTGRVLTEPQAAHQVFGAIRDKYGWQYWVSRVLSKLARPKERPYAMELSV